MSSERDAESLAATLSEHTHFITYPDGSAYNCICVVSADHGPLDVELAAARQELHESALMVEQQRVELGRLIDENRGLRAEQIEKDAQIAEKIRQGHVTALSTQGTFFDSRWEQGAAGAADRIAAAIRDQQERGES